MYTFRISVAPKYNVTWVYPDTLFIVCDTIVLITIIMIFFCFPLTTKQLLIIITMIFFLFSPTKIQLLIIIILIFF